VTSVATDESFAATGYIPDDIRSSPLWNPDLAPTDPSRRTWSTYNIAALWIGMSVVITTYTLASGLMEQGMTWWQAMVTILLGNVIVLVPMVLNAHAGTKYGISFPVLCRASFGVRGANIAAMLRAIVACGWFGIQTWIGALALDALFTAAWPGWSAVSGSTAIAFAICNGLSKVWPWPIVRLAMSPLRSLRPWVAFMYSSFGTRPSASPRNGIPHFTPNPSRCAHSIIGSAPILIPTW
jgi:NCS1 nucleoside transporter family